MAPAVPASTESDDSPSTGPAKLTVAPVGTAPAAVVSSAAKPISAVEPLSEIAPPAVVTLAPN